MAGTLIRQSKSKRSPRFRIARGSRRDEGRRAFDTWAPIVAVIVSVFLLAGAVWLLLHARPWGP